MFLCSETLTRYKVFNADISQSHYCLAVTEYEDDEVEKSRSHFDGLEFCFGLPNNLENLSFWDMTSSRSYPKNLKKLPIELMLHSMQTFLKVY